MFAPVSLLSIHWSCQVVPALFPCLSRMYWLFRDSAVASFSGASLCVGHKPRGYITCTLCPFVSAVRTPLPPLGLLCFGGRRNEGDSGRIRCGAEGDAVASTAASAGVAGEAQGLRPRGRLRLLGRALAGGAQPPREGHRGLVILVITSWLFIAILDLRICLCCVYSRLLTEEMRVCGEFHVVFRSKICVFPFLVHETEIPDSWF